MLNLVLQLAHLKIHASTIYDPFHSVYASTADLRDMVLVNNRLVARAIGKRSTKRRCLLLRNDRRWLDPGRKRRSKKGEQGSSSGEGKPGSEDGQMLLTPIKRFSFLLLVLLIW